MTRIKRRIEINVFIANLEKYNEGNLIGDWFDLFEATDEEITAAIGEGETIILDYEAPEEMHIDEYENITNLIEFAQSSTKIF